MLQVCKAFFGHNPAQGLSPDQTGSQEFAVRFYYNWKRAAYLRADQLGWSLTLITVT
jgi:hypothetical protein